MSEVAQKSAISQEKPSVDEENKMMSASDAKRLAEEDTGNTNCSKLNLGIIGGLILVIGMAVLTSLVVSGESENK